MRLLSVAIIVAALPIVSARAQPPAAAPPVAPAQPPAAAAPGQAMPAAPAEQAPEAYSYESEGRRDPFINLLGTGGDAAPSLVRRRGDGPASMSAAEISVRGIMQSRGALIAMIEGPDKKTYVVHQGDKFIDGAIKSITPQGLIIVQDINDPLSLVKHREIRKLLRSIEESKVTVTRGFALLLPFVLASAGARTPGLEAGAMATVRLKTITSRVSGKGAALVIETTEPVAYLMTRPDPLTLLVDFRNVDAEGVANSVGASATSPIATVVIERADSLGVPMSRVRITLTRPVAHRVRSVRNTVVIDFDRVSANAAPYVMPPVSRTASEAMGALQTPAAGGPTGVDPVTALGLRTLAAQASGTPGSPASRGSQPPSVSPASPAPETPTIAGAVIDPATVLRDQAAAAQPQPDQIETAPGARKFTGNPVSLDFQGADLRAVLRTFAEISGLNIVIDPTVQGTVDVALRDVPWDQALDIILRANRLGYLIDGTIVRIAPLSSLADEESQHRKLTEEQALAGQLVVMTKTLSYAKAVELMPLLTKSALSSRGTVQIDPRTNTVIITDLPDRLATATSLITTLDRPQPQVEIEARIVQTNRNYARQLGVQWGFNGAATPALGNTTPLAFPNSAVVGGLASPGSAGQPLQGVGGVVPTAVNLPVPGATSAVGLALGSINGAFNLDVALSALKTTGNGRLLSTPKVSTLNNVAAEMTQGIQIPIQTVANNTVTVTFKDAALTLRVTPQITAANTVIMQIAVENSTADFSHSINGIPPIDTQRANTTVLVRDGQTTVIGGIYTSTVTSQKDSTPGLGNIPIISWLFKHDQTSDANTELLIFITPRIIKG